MRSCGAPGKAMERCARSSKRNPNSYIERGGRALLRSSTSRMRCSRSRRLRRITKFSLYETPPRSPSKIFSKSIFVRIALGHVPHHHNLNVEQIGRRAGLQILHAAEQLRAGGEKQRLGQIERLLRAAEAILRVHRLLLIGGRFLAAVIQFEKLEGE